MRRLAVLLFLVSCPAALSAQDVRATTLGDTFIGYVLATLDSAIGRRAKTAPDTVRAPMPVPVPGRERIDTAPAPTRDSPGRPFGAFNGTGSFSTLALESTAPERLPGQLRAARARNSRLVLAPAGGSHARYIVRGKFDLARWKARVSTFNTATAKAAVADAVADGTLLGMSLMDEPNHPSWGGVVTPAMLDEMSRYLKGIFPTVKTAVVVQWTWQRSLSYSSVDFLISQYSARLGDLAAYVDSAEATTGRRGVGLMFSMNVLNGGARLDPCPAGRYEPGRVNCSMTPKEITAVGTALLGSQRACGLLMWQYDRPFYARPENATAFATLAAYAARQPAPPCRRP